MTFFLGGDRHFDQVKRVEKSPKAKHYFVVKKRFTTIITACRVYRQSLATVYHQRLSLHIIKGNAFVYHHGLPCIHLSPKGKAKR